MRRRRLPILLYPLRHARDRDAKRLLNYELPYELVDHVLSTLLHVTSARKPRAHALPQRDDDSRDGRRRHDLRFHTRNHRVCRVSPPKATRRDRIGVPWIRELTGQREVPFCYPHGHAHAYTHDSAILQERAMRWRSPPSAASPSGACRAPSNFRVWTRAMCHRRWRRIRCEGHRAIEHTRGGGQRARRRFLTEPAEDGDSQSLELSAAG